VDNWFAARAFQLNAAGPNSVRPPIGYMTSNVLQPATGYMRTFVGTGDRLNLIDEDGPNCRLSNGYGCARNGCTVRNTVTIDRGAASTLSSNAIYTASNFTSSANTAGATGNACTLARAKVVWDYDSSANCTQASAGTLEYLCSGTPATWSCGVVTNNWDTSTHLPSTPPATNADRFLGFYSYGGATASRRFNTSAQANTYDTAFGGNPMGEGDLVDLTSGAVSDPAGNGWYIRYATGSIDERTGSGSTVLDGCVLWNSFQPTAGGSTICATSGENVARFYQANYATGEASCASSFYDATDGGWQRSRSRTVVAVPGEPAPQRTIAAGSGSTSIVTLEAGSNQGDAVTATKELMQSMFQLEVDRPEHACRHESTGCK
jgi:type IV pilus assembly protein PilY1